MTTIEKRLEELKSPLLPKLHETKEAVKLLLQQYISNFPTYTDHSANHTWEVFKLAGNVMSDEERNKLNEDELYVLGMACLLHDIGMCVPMEKLDELGYKKRYEQYKTDYPETEYADYLRDIHHELSADFIRREYKELKIESPAGSDRYTEAIARVAMGHRKVNLQSIDIYKPNFSVRSGSREFVCLPYLACVLRIADELDVTNIRTPALLVKYYLPENKISREEFEKHLATTHVEFDNEKVIITAKPDKEPIYNAIKKQLDKIGKVIEDCQKVVRHISNTGAKTYKLQLDKLVADIQPQGFVPYDIKFTLDTPRIFETFIGKHLYDTPYVAIRESIQNAIDSCRYRKTLEPEYEPQITVALKDGRLIIEDNATGMDEFIVAHYFGKLGSSYYLQQQIRENYHAIGQFGIGVFSYFLIGDCIEVETKTKKQRGLHFTATKEPDDYFHFSSNYDGPEQGTRLKIHLNAEQKVKLTMTELEHRIRHYFRYVEFPIIIKAEQTDVIIKSRSFELTVEEFIAPHLDFKHRNLKGFEIFQIHMKEVDFEGSIGILVYDNKQDKKIQPASTFFAYNASKRTLEYNQKGILVNETGTRYSLRNNVCLKLNIQSEAPIQLSRNSFDRRQFTNNFVGKLIHNLANKLFETFADSTYEERSSLLNLVNDSFSLLDFNLSEETIFLTKERGIVCYSLVEEKHYSNFSEFLIRFESFIHSGVYTYTEIPDTFKKLPTLVSFYSLEHTLGGKICQLSGYNQTLLVSTSNCIKIYKRGATKPEYLADCFFYNIEHLDSDRIYFAAGELEEGMYPDFYFNINHPFSRHILQNIEAIEKNTLLVGIISSIQSDIRHSLNGQIDFASLTGLMDSFNKEAGTSFKLSKEDFPDYTRFT
jgi:HD superfamily phosphodiesterase